MEAGIHLPRKFTYQIYETQGENTIRPLVDNIKDRPIVPENVLNSYSISPLSQRIQDYRLYSDNFYKFGQSDIKVFLGGSKISEGNITILQILTRPENT